MLLCRCAACAGLSGDGLDGVSELPYLLAGRKFRGGWPEGGRAMVWLACCVSNQMCEIVTGGEIETAGKWGAATGESR